MIVSGRIPTGNRALRINHLGSTITPDSEADMAWTIGDKGFEMVLSTYIPRILEANVGQIVDDELKRAGRRRADIHHWAIHPGGRAILDKISRGLQLEPNELDASREVLRQYGNMSSATILFVLKEMLSSGVPAVDETIFAMAFGPGLTIESALFTRM